MENNNAETPTATHIHDGADGANPDFPNARNKKTVVDILENAGMETGLELEISRAIVRYINCVVDQRVKDVGSVDTIVDDLVKNDTAWTKLVTNLKADPEFEHYVERMADEVAESKIDEADLVTDDNVEDIIDDKIDNYFSRSSFNINRE
jgi:hypothetical protein|tara:strand:- start:260 stop:709 length:450 start_codon:yes stop_codon:yes gene_type:complete